MRWWITLVIVLLMVFSAGGAEGQVVGPDPVCVSADSRVADPEAVNSVLEDLAPGTKHNVVTLVYRRHGLAEAQIPTKIAGWRPECSLTEVLMEFDDSGDLASYDGEVRGLDGTPWQSWELEGDDLVFRDGDGAEFDRSVGFRLGYTAESERNSLKWRMSLAATAVAAQPSAPTTMLDSKPVVVLEERKPAKRPGEAAPPGPGAQVTGSNLPYVADLAPEEEITWRYFLSGEDFLVHREVVIVGEDGVETVVEGDMFQVFEVIVLTPTPTP